VSGPHLDQRGSFLELSWGGREPLTIEGLGDITFLDDGDTITITGTALATDGTLLHLGDVTGTIRPAT
jgi:fumarylacetoacetase